MQVLRHLVPYHDPDVLVDATTSDDAAVYRIGDNRVLVVTVDFFTPVVDDPYDFGRIAAANALSDIYAMGARPRFALNLIAFPRDLLHTGMLEHIVRGGGDVALEAGIAVVGGHSIDDAEPKFGMCVIGDAAENGVMRNSGAQPGDVLVLTKPIGTGIISTAIKRGVASDDETRAAVACMATLNRGAAEAMVLAGASAATDVTGFGLLGHMRNMLRASQVSATVHAAAVPLLPGAERLAIAGTVPGGTRRNADDLAPDITWAGDVADHLRVLLCDAQTSGGLLISIAPDRLDRLMGLLREAGTPVAAVIGAIRPASEPLIDVRL